MIHETAIIDENVIIHPTAKIWHWTHIRENAQIGENVIIGQCCYIDHDVVIPKGCKIQNNVSVYFGVAIEEDVFIGPSVVFTNDKYPRAFPNNWKVSPTIIHKGASIGAGALILCGITIGEYAMIGTGAVIVADVPSYAVMIGTPAKQKGYCGEEGYPSLKQHRHFRHSDFPGYDTPWEFGEYIRVGEYTPLEIMDKRMTWMRIGRGGLSIDSMMDVYAEYYRGDRTILRKALSQYYPTFRSYVSQK